MPEVVRADGRDISDAMGELPDGRLHGQEGPQGIAIFAGRISPVGLDRVPEFAQPFFVGIAVLDDESGHAGGVFGEHAVTDRRAVIHQIDRVVVHTLGVDQLCHDLGRVGKAVVIVRRIRHVGRAKAGIIGGDHMVVAGQFRDQVAEHM